MILALALLSCVACWAISFFGGFAAGKKRGANEAFGYMRMVLDSLIREGAITLAPDFDARMTALEQLARAGKAK